MCVSVRKVYCGKTADWIRIPFGVVSGVGRGMGVLDGSVRDRRRGRAVLGVIGNLCDALFLNYFEDLLKM